ncbi:MAG: GntR family transcriptional regulator [Bacteroidales bacterium]|nr:GntR family transcriptional regulator [Bacteroidales bacterium]
MEFNDNKAIYLQLADQIMNAIERGDFNDGDRIPSVREYAAQSGVNANTVMRTFSWLQQEEIIFNKRGIGYFFCEGARERVRQMRREHFLKKDLPYFLERMKALDISLDDFINLYNNPQTID